MSQVLLTTPHARLGIFKESLNWRGQKKRSGQKKKKSASILHIAIVIADSEGADRSQKAKIKQNDFARKLFWQQKGRRVDGGWWMVVGAD